MPGVRCGRAGQIAAAAGLSTGRGKVETLRSKLKRLAERGWLAAEAGLFALPARNGHGAGEAVKPGGWRAPPPSPGFLGKLNFSVLPQAGVGAPTVRVHA